MISFMYMYLFLLSADPANRHEIQVLKFSWWSLDARIGFWGLSQAECLGKVTRAPKLLVHI